MSRPGRPVRHVTPRAHRALWLTAAFLAAGCILAPVLQAQTVQPLEVRIGASADTVALRVGEQAKITVTVDYPAGTAIRNIGPADSLRGVEIVRVDSSTAGSAGVSPLTRVYTVTSFDSGLHVVPPFVAWYATPSDTTVRRVSGPSITLYFRGVEVDTSAEIRAIKPPLDVPLSLAEILPYAVAIIAVALLTWLAVRLYRKRKRGEGFIPGPPPRPEDEVALEALRSIDAERLWQRGKVKEYHTALSDVVRTYIERRFEVPAMESTSDEILASGSIEGLGRETVAGLRDLLLRSDLVKFAKFVPAADQNERSFSGSVSFVESTRRRRNVGMPGENTSLPVSPASPAAAPVAAGAGAPPDGGGVAR